MSPNVVISFIIGGIITLTLGWMFYSITYNSSEVTMTQSRQMNKVDISEVISYDFPKIGYTPSVSQDSLIQVADSNRIVFYSNLDNSADNSIETVTWELSNTPVAATENPDDFVLLRIVDGDTTRFNLGVTRFRLRYYSTIGSNTEMTFPMNQTNRDAIRQIQIELVLEGSDGLKFRSTDAAEYVETAWIKRFTPRNLSLNL